jgi:hypothetical protein
MGLSADQIAALLTQPERKPRGGPKKSKSTTEIVKSGGPHTIQFGPLKYYEEITKCTSKGCGSSSMLRINGIPFCGTHSLDVLNKMVIDSDPEKYLNGVDLDSCNCKAGAFSRKRIHTKDCILFQESSEEG